MHTLLYGDDMTKTFSTDQKPQALYVSELLTYYKFFIDYESTQYSDHYEQILQNV